MRAHDMQKQAVQTWQGFAVDCGLPVKDYTAATLWTKTEPNRAHIVLRLSHANQPDLVLKQIFIPSDGAGLMAAVQAQQVAMTALIDAPGHFVPEILASSAAPPAVLMQHWQGETANDLFLAAKDTAARQRILEQAGAWMAAYHSGTQNEIRAFDSGFMARRMVKMADEVAGGSRRVARKDRFVQCANQLPEIAKDFAGQDIRSCATHGDLNIRNLLIGAQGVAAIDFKPHHFAPTGHDTARFLLDYAELFAQKSKLQAGEIIAADDLQAFSKGYGHDLASDPAFQFLSKVRILQDWLAIPPGPNNRSLRQHHRFKGVQRLAKFAFPEP